MKARKDLGLLQDRLSLLDVPHVKSVVLFGSRARGESGERSDVDLLVLLENCEVEDLTLSMSSLGVFLSPRRSVRCFWMFTGMVYDKTGGLCDSLRGARERIVKSGLKRVGNREAYFWVLPKPTKEVKIL